MQHRAIFGIWLSQAVKYKSSHPDVFFKKSVLKSFGKFTGKHMCWSLFFIKYWCTEKETSGKVFPCEFCEFSGYQYVIETNKYSKVFLPWF